MGGAPSKPKLAAAPTPADDRFDDRASHVSRAITGSAPAPAVQPPPPVAAPPHDTVPGEAAPPLGPDEGDTNGDRRAMSQPDDRPGTGRRRSTSAASVSIARMFGRRGAPTASDAGTEALDPDEMGHDGRRAASTVQEVSGREELRKARDDAQQEEYNQTGQTVHEIRALARYASVPERERPPGWEALRTDDMQRRESRVAHKEEKRESRAARKSERAARRSKVPPELPPARGTVAFAVNDAKRLGVLNLAKMQLGSVPDPVFEGLDGTTRVINVSGNNLQGIDSRFTELVLVQRLIANDNLISTVPPSVSRMSALRKLDLANNKLSTVPDSFANMPHLEHVDLSDNGLSSLPDSFATLNLITLRLTRNNFTAPPRVIEAMRSLQELYLDANRLVAVPPSWSSLTLLSRLHLDTNHVADFPDDILAGCTALVNLSIRGNPLTAARLEAKPSWAEFHARRLTFHNYRIEGGTLSVDDLRVADA